MTASSRDTEWTAWMLGALAGDDVAYRRFLLSVTPFIRAVARRHCRHLSAADGEAEDIVQEALLAIHLKRGTWDQSRPVAPWVAAIVRNKVVDALRRRGHRVSVPIEEVIDSLPTEDRTAGISPRDIDTLLDQLKPSQREIVRSISLNGSSIQETAARLKMSEGAVRVSLHRALKTLGALYRSQPGAD